MTQITFFPDTNLFLQCKDLGQLPWNEFGEHEIHLVVARVVQEELDRLKSDVKGRRSKRARKACSLFRQVLRAEDDHVPVRAERPRVSLSLARPLPTNRTRPASLDLTLADHRLIEEVLAHRQHTDESVRVLSDDTGVLLCARDHGLPYIEIPESWLLDAEADEKDKQIHALTEQLRGYQRAEPQLTIAIYQTGQAKAELVHSVSTIEALSPSYLDELEAQVLAANPETEQFDSPAPANRDPLSVMRIIGPVGSGRKWEPPTEEAIEEYHRAYGAWRAGVRRQFQKWPEKTNSGARSIPFSIVLDNQNGARAAERLLLEIFAHDGLLLRFDVEAQNDFREGRRRPVSKRVLLDRPPTPPTGQFVAGALADRLIHSVPRIETPRLIHPPLPELISPTEPSIRYPHRFYVRDPSKNSLATEWALECDEFRHGADPATFHFELVVPTGTSVERSHLHCRLSAINLSRTLNHRLPILLSYHIDSAPQAGLSWLVRRRWGRNP